MRPRNRTSGTLRPVPCVADFQVAALLDVASGAVKAAVPDVADVDAAHEGEVAAAEIRHAPYLAPLCGAQSR